MGWKVMIDLRGLLLSVALLVGLGYLCWCAAYELTHHWTPIPCPHGNCPDCPHAVWTPEKGWKCACDPCECPKKD